jgi:Uma2 family endonuclease
VEVSDSTIRLDRGRKRARYARAGISEYCIVTLRDQQLEVYRDPVGSRYRETIILGPDELVTPLTAPHTAIRVADLLAR